MQCQPILQFRLIPWKATTLQRVAPIRGVASATTLTAVRIAASGLVWRTQAVWMKQAEAPSMSETAATEPTIWSSPQAKTALVRATAMMVPTWALKRVTLAIHSIPIINPTDSSKVVMADALKTIVNRLPTPVCLSKAPGILLYGCERIQCHLGRFHRDLFCPANLCLGLQGKCSIDIWSYMYTRTYSSNQSFSLAWIYTI